MDLIYVVAADQGVPDDPDAGVTANAPVALWERHPDHPDGEVFVAGPGVVRVAQTAEVINRLKDGRLVRVTKGGKPYQVKAADEPDTPPPDDGTTPPPDDGITGPPVTP